MKMAIHVMCFVIGTLAIMVCITSVCPNKEVDPSTDLKAEAIQSGLAEYNPTNGNWQWKDK